MAELKGTRTRKFMQISERLGRKFDSRQLCHYWRNYLNEELSLVSLVDKEKLFIDEWISSHKNGNGQIKWVNLRNDMKAKHGLLKSENMVKNYWYSKLRRQKTKTDLKSPDVMTLYSEIGIMSSDHDKVISDDVDDELGLDLESYENTVAVTHPDPDGHNVYKLLNPPPNTLQPDYKPEVYKLPVDI